MSKRQEVGIDVVARDLASKALRDVGGELSNVGEKARSSSGHFGRLGGAVSNMAGGIFMGVGMAGFNALSGAVGGLGSSIVGMNAQLETSELQFATLMGDADKAKAHVAGLFDFAAKTPFETTGIIQASRTMETFGGDALNTADNLKLFGDAAAAVSQPIEDVGFWMSRAYADIQAGRPFGEAAMRLSEMGILAPQTRNELEALQKAGAKGPEVWGKLTGALGKFGGAMEKQAGTFDGMMSTFRDTVQMGLANAFQPLFLGLKDTLAGVNTFLGSDGAQATIKSFGEVVGSVIGDVVDVFTALRPIIGEALSFVGQIVSDLVASFAPVVDAMRPVLDMISGLFGSLKAGGATTLSVFEGIGPKLAGVYQSIYAAIGTAIGQIVPKIAEFAGKFIDWIAPMIPPMLAELASFFLSMVGWVGDQIPKIAAKLVEWAEAFVDWIGPRIPGMLAELGKMLVSVGTWIVTKGAPALVSKLVEWAGAFLGWIVPMIPPLLIELGKMLVGIGVWIVTEALPAFLGWAGDMAGQLIRGLVEGVVELPDALGKALTDAFRSISIQLGPFRLHNGVFTFDMDLPWEARAFGGPVNANMPYIVGERGPELFVPNTPGTIIPNSALPGPTLGPAAAVAGGGGTVNLTVSSQYFGGSKADARGFARDLYDLLVDEDRRRGGQMFVGA